jgi:hypothetical protein
MKTRNYVIATLLAASSQGALQCAPDHRPWPTACGIRGAAVALIEYIGIVVVIILISGLFWLLVRN